jgi:hypothetical protein
LSRGTGPHNHWRAGIFQSNITAASIGIRIVIGLWMARGNRPQQFGKAIFMVMAVQRNLVYSALTMDMRAIRGD